MMSFTSRSGGAGNASGGSRSRRPVRSKSLRGWTTDPEAVGARSVRRDGGGCCGSRLDGVNGDAIAGLIDERLLSFR